MASVYEIFESYECHRCSGAGRIHGFSHVLGGVCFQCNGSRYLFTRTGQRDYDAWRAAVDELVTKPVTDVQPGVAVQLRGFRKYYPVTSIEGPVSLGYGQIIDGETVWTQGYKITFGREISVDTGTPLGAMKQQTWDVPCDSTVRIHPGQGLIPKAETFDSRQRVAS